MTDVTDADRRAAIELLSQRGFTDEWVQDLFARHREASIAPSVEREAELVEALREARAKFALIAGRPEWNEDDGPEPYNPRWSAEQYRDISRQALAKIDALLENAK